ncbi:class II aldolase/adducin family protein [Roseomonas sp. KE2513]|uniref:class II aldolase/adducin family protein n=1 Tax=Roseomonas sp. KE2513 TaxID=2479202 RepID=UPI0018DF1AFB|nr:class II aldolase/adducin family protein [Roseomonas sp. KE2513]MBI0535550.1 class II aldolase/adducin family protein [Roseomonas sp. KE2513]
MTEAILRDLALANRLLARDGIVDDFGHVAHRDLENPERFWLSRALPSNRVTPGDLRLHGPDGVCEDNSVGTYSEAVLHARVFAAHPDVQVSIHHHARPLLPFTMPGAPPLRPVFHTGAVAGWDIPVWDSAPFGAGGMLVDTVEKGDSLAACLGQSRAVLLRGHGAVVVGPDIATAVMVAIYMVENAAVALAAGATARPVPGLSREEVAETARRLLTPNTVARVWAGRIAGLEG